MTIFKAVLIIKLSLAPVFTAKKGVGGSVDGSAKHTYSIILQ